MKDFDVLAMNSQLSFHDIFDGMLPFGAVAAALAGTELVLSGLVLVNLESDNFFRPKRSEKFDPRR